MVIYLQSCLLQRVDTPFASKLRLVRDGTTSHDSDLVCDFESIMLLVNNNISLLLSVWSDKSVHFSNLDAVQVLASLFDCWLCGFLLNQKDESVVIFDGLDSALSAKWVLNDGEFVPGGFLLVASLWSEWFSCLSQSSW